jgi:hypothetical protein
MGPMRRSRISIARTQQSMFPDRRVRSALAVSSSLRLSVDRPVACPPRSRRTIRSACAFGVEPLAHEQDLPSAPARCPAVEDGLLPARAPVGAWVWGEEAVAHGNPPPACPIAAPRCRRAQQLRAMNLPKPSSVSRRGGGGGAARRRWARPWRTDQPQSRHRRASPQTGAWRRTRMPTAGAATSRSREKGTHPLRTRGTSEGHPTRDDAGLCRPASHFGGSKL